MCKEGQVAVSKRKVGDADLPEPGRANINGPLRSVLRTAYSFAPTGFWARVEGCQHLIWPVAILATLAGWIG